jgi:predicted DNA-binding transcriptional regulator YafY
VRASRLVSILLLLQNRGRMTAAELADELETSVRTIYRDLEALAIAGVPVYADRGPGGGYQLVDGYRTRLTGLTEGEAEALSLTGVPDAAAELGLGTVLAAAELKLQAALPRELQARAGRVRERFHLDAPGWFRDDEAHPTPHLATVAQAVWDQKVLAVRYKAWGSNGGESDRRLQPLGLVLKAGTWYLVARNLEAAPLVPRTYRVSRLLRVAVTDEGFEWPDGFELASFWADYSERFETSVYRAEAVVRLSPVAMRSLDALWPAVPAKAARETASPPDGDGWVTCTIPIESVQHARFDLLKLGGDAEALEPPELRTQIQENLTRMQALYAPKTRSGG